MAAAAPSTWRIIAGLEYGSTNQAKSVLGVLAHVSQGIFVLRYIHSLGTPDMKTIIQNPISS